jgi:pimeloyl-ACP methyl ester carboxylesterase
VNVFGGYFDLRSYMVAVATETEGAADAKEQWLPAEATVRMFAQNVAALISNPIEYQTIVNRLKNPLVSDQNLDIALSATGQSVYTLLTSREPTLIKDALNALPTQHQAFFDSLSPSKVISRVEAPIFVMHDRDDPYVPAQEARMLQKSVPAEQLTYQEFTFFAHVRPDHHSVTRSTLLVEYGQLSMYLAPILRTLTPQEKATS